MTANSLTPSRKFEPFSIPLKGQVEQVAGMGNLLCDIPGEAFAFYFGGGLGYRHEQGCLRLELSSSVEAKESITRISNGAFAYQGIVGLTFCLFPKLEVGLDYRYLDGGSEGISNNTIMLSFIRSF